MATIISEPPPPDFESLLVHLRESRGFDFTAYKRSTLQRRVRKRMSAVHVESYTDYVDYLEVHQEEFEALFNTILINVTSFFRDPPAWDELARSIIPQILTMHADGSPIRAWSAGCASGQEAYTLAILLCEAMGADSFRERVKIYATDVDEEELVTARQASYSARELVPVAPDLRERYFEANGDRFSFRKDMRRTVIFGRHDLIQDAPISRLDLLVSRNTLMYFNADAQSKIVARFYYALNEGGYMFLGKAETLLAHTQNFNAVDLRYRLFVKPYRGDMRERSSLKVDFAPNEDRPGEDSAVRDLAFEFDPVAQILVDSNLTLALANERARELFNLSLRDVGRPLQDLEMSYRPVELRSSIDRAFDESKPIELQDVHFPSSSVNGGRWFDIRITPLRDRQQTVGAKISFVDVTSVHELSLQLEQSRGDLETAYEELQSSNEELETTNEELQSTVEELETTNEELQSTNEELETMNEELQSTNEELEAVNDEIRDRGNTLNHVNSFLESILTSLRDGVIVVDSELVIRGWNRRAEDLWGVRSEEARGTLVVNLDIGMPIAGILEPIRVVLAGRNPEYEGFFEATNRRGRAIRCRVTITPMRDEKGTPTGAVILMEEIEPESETP